MAEEAVVPYVQRRLPQNGGAGHATAPVPDGLHDLLFYPIAGDSLAPDTTLRAAISLRWLQFARRRTTPNPGYLTRRPWPTCPWSPSPTQARPRVRQPGFHSLPATLSDARMGPGPGSTGACQTCRQQRTERGWAVRPWASLARRHHNCPGHFGRIQLPHPVVNPLFVPLVAVVLQSVCMHCCRLRLSPHYVNHVIPGRGRPIQRLKAVAALCGRPPHCQFCRAPPLLIRSQGLSILARQSADTPWVTVPAVSRCRPTTVAAGTGPTAIFAVLVQLPAPWRPRPEVRGGLGPGL